jgi:hypothetical protein
MCEGVGPAKGEAEISCRLPAGNALNKGKISERMFGCSWRLCGDDGFSHFVFLDRAHPPFDRRDLYMCQPLDLGFEPSQVSLGYVPWTAK